MRAPDQAVNMCPECASKANSIFFPSVPHFINFPLMHFIVFPALDDFFSLITAQCEVIRQALVAKKCLSIPQRRVYTSC
jgi:hypothetical protein